MTGTIQNCWGLYGDRYTIVGNGRTNWGPGTRVDLTNYTALRYEVEVSDSDPHAEIRRMARQVLDPGEYYKDVVAEHRANGVPVVREVVVVVNGEEREMTFEEFTREYGAASTDD